MTETTPIAVLIVGMHRSGTSAVAGSLSRLGVPLGRHLLAAGEDNRKGYFEHEEAVRIDDALLAALDRSWEDPRALPDGWPETEAARAAEAAIGQLLAQEFSGLPLFALKDPRFCRLLPLWKRALRNAGVEPRVLLVIRHPSEVAASLHKRNDFAPALSQALWLEHMLVAEQDSRDCRRAVVAYDALMANPDAALMQALDTLALSDRLAPEQLARLAGFVSADERHFSGGAVLSPGSDLDPMAEEALALFKAAPLDATGFDQLRQRHQAQHGSTCDLATALAARVLAVQQMQRATAVELAEQRSLLHAQLAWSQAAVVEREGLQAELAETKSALHAQVEWSEEAVRVREGLYAELARMHELETQNQGLQALLTRYETSLLGRLQRRWMAWQDKRGQSRKETGK